MEYSYSETRMESYSHKARDLGKTRNTTLEMKMRELQNTKEELKTAKDDAMQSWLDSRPLIDELEKLQSSLDVMKNRITMSTTVISDLESQLETTNKAIKLKREDELKVRTTINEMNRVIDQTREEMEQLKLEKDEERRERSELKQVLRLRKQRLRALQLTLRAIRLDTEAFGSSTAEALRYINHSEMDNTTTVQLTQKEYYALTRKAKEETSLAEWRVSVSVEQRLVAEASRESASRKLKELHNDNKLRKRKKKGKIDGNVIRDAEEQDSRLGEGIDQVNNRRSAFPKARAEFIDSSQGNPQVQQQLRRTKSNSKKVVKKKRASIFVRIRAFLVRKIARLFG